MLCKHWQCPARRKTELRGCENPAPKNSRDCGRDRESPALSTAGEMCSSNRGVAHLQPLLGAFSLPVLSLLKQGFGEDTEAAGTRQSWHRQRQQRVRRLPAPAVIHNTFLSVEDPFQPALENTGSRAGTHRGASPPERAEPVSQPSQIGCEEEEEEEERSRNPPPPGRCSASPETGVRGRIFPRVLWGRVIPGRLRRRGCDSIFPTSKQSQTMEKREKAGGRKKWKNK